MSMQSTQMNFPDNSVVLPYASTDAIEIARSIAMPDQVIQTLLHLRDAEHGALCKTAQCHSLLCKLCERGERRDAWHKLKAAIGDDPDGFMMLFSMLTSAGQYSLPKYRALQLPDAIFLDTMKAFSRFVAESLTRYHRYAFDRDFWTYRQLSLTLFRVGSLEYEYAEEPYDIEANIAGPVINIHIPSDADLHPESVDASLQEWDRYVARYFPQWQGLPKICTSWMLSPALDQLLPASSNIRSFQRRFRCFEFNADAADWREWVFNADTASVEHLPAHSSLQKNMKQFILNGGKVGVASAILGGSKGTPLSSRSHL